MKRIEEYIEDPAVSTLSGYLYLYYLHIGLIHSRKQKYKTHAEPDVLPEPRNSDADFNKLREADEDKNGDDTFEETEYATSTVSTARSQPASARKVATAKKAAARASLPMKFKVNPKVKITVIRISLKIKVC